MPEVQIDEYEFERRYQPILTETGGWRDFSWAEPDELEMIRAARAEHRVWTTMDDDDGFVILSSGWHFVNRLGYVITELPFDPNDDISVYDPEDREEWMERITTGDLSE